MTERIDNLRGKSKIPSYSEWYAKIREWRNNEIKSAYHSEIINAMMKKRMKTARFPRKLKKRLKRIGRWKIAKGKQWISTPFPNKTNLDAFCHKNSNMGVKIQDVNLGAIIADDLDIPSECKADYDQVLKKHWNPRQ